MPDEELDLHDIVILPTGVVVDGVPMPYLLADNGVLVTANGAHLAEVTVTLFAKRVTVLTGEDLEQDQQPTPTAQQQARAIFAAHNPAAFKETSA